MTLKPSTDPKERDLTTTTSEVKQIEMDQLLGQGFGTPNPPLTLHLKSTLLGEERRIYVQLPEGHGRSSLRYPVLLVLDAEWLFDSARAHVRFFSDYETMDVALPKMIVVGIENTDRDRNFVPTKDPKDEPDFPTAGEADKFLEFLRDELFPCIDNRFQTEPSRTIAGWSFGGLFSMYSAIAMPELFDAYLCISPSLWWDNQFLVDEYAACAGGFARPKRMVITQGGLEVDGWPSTARLLKLLEEQPLDGLSVSHLVCEGEEHCWGIPAALDKGLRMLFSRYLPSAPDDLDSIEAIEVYYQELSTRWGFAPVPHADVLLGLASKEWTASNEEAALAVVDRLLEQDPEASRAYLRKGVYLSRQGNPQEALTILKSGLAAELRRSVPEGVMLRAIQKRITELEESSVLS